MRVYIDAIASKQIRLYYTKFTPKIKRAQLCIIHGYGESTDDYLNVNLLLFRWLNTMQDVGLLLIWWICVGLAILGVRGLMNLRLKFCQIFKHF
jgi:hypothetical protein